MGGPAAPLLYPAIRTDEASPLSIGAYQEYTFGLPGTGKITQLGVCGTWTKIAACSRDPKHYSKPIAHNCGHIECPECWDQPVGKSAKKASSRIRGYIDLALRTGMASQVELIVNHYQLSPPKGLVLPGMENNKIKEMGRRIAIKAGIVGGVMAFHPYRIKKDVARQLGKQCIENQFNHPEEREKKFWELVRDNALGMDSWMDYVHWSPHYHVIGFGKLPDQNTPEQKEAVKKLYKGWVVTWIRHVNDYHQFDGTKMHDPIAELAFYIFSHAGYQCGKKIPVWLGACSPNNLAVVKSQKQEYQVVCPKCQAPVVMGTEEGGKFIPDVLNGEWVTHVHRSTDIVYGIRRKFKKLPPRRDEIISPDPRDLVCYASESSQAFKDLNKRLSWIGLTDYSFWRVYTR